MRTRDLALAAIACACESTQVPPTALVGCVADEHGQTSPAFHGGPARIGWDSQEPGLSPSAISAGFGPIWSSAELDGAIVSGVQLRGRAYASPIFADDVVMHDAIYEGAQLSVVFAATSNGYVYAVSAFDTPCASRSIPAGQILWRSQLVTPAIVPTLDGGAALGTLSTPVLDLHSNPPILYVTAMDAAGGAFTWKAFALDASRGTVLPGWPVVLDRTSVEAANGNGPARFDDDARVVSQRSALALGPDGDRLYVTFGGYWDGAVGWIVAIDTQAAKIAASFSGAPDPLLDPQGNLSRHANAGMWGPSGPAIDSQGHVYTTTGNSDSAWEGRGRTWGNSLLRFTKDLALDRTYTPFNFCALDEGDVDVGGSSAVILPSLASLPTSTPSLVAFGGKQGVAYLLDATHITGALDSRPACSTSWDDSSRDSSLLPPTTSNDYCNFAPHETCVPPVPSQECVTGPVVAFGPPGDIAAIDHAKMRTTPAFFRRDDGTPLLYLSGSTKASLCSIDAVPPSLVRMRVAADAGGPAYLVRDAADTEMRFLNPGSPVVTSHGGADPVVWVLDENAPRTASLLDSTTPHPVLYAVDGETMKVLYRSGQGDLDVGGKYATPLVAHGTVFVVTDRVQAFGLK
jgi:hypothetical protein